MMHRFCAHRHERLADFAERNEDYFGSLGDSCLTVDNIGYDLKQALDVREQKCSIADFHDDLEGEYTLFMALDNGSFSTDKRINGRINATHFLESSLTRCYKKASVME